MENTNLYNRFKVQVLVVDGTGETTLTLFDSEVHKLRGVSATQLINHYGGSMRDLPTQFGNLRGRTFIFQLKVTDYNLIYGKEDYAVLKIFDIERNNMVGFGKPTTVKIEDEQTHEITKGDEKNVQNSGIDSCSKVSVEHAGPLKGDEGDCDCDKEKHAKKKAKKGIK